MPEFYTAASAAQAHLQHWQLVMPTNSSPEKSFLVCLQTHLPSALPEFLLQQRWFGGKARQIHSVEIPDIVPLTTVNSYLIFARINYASGPAETYAIPLSGSQVKARLHR